MNKKRYYKLNAFGSYGIMDTKKHDFLMLTTCPQLRDEEYDKLDNSLKIIYKKEIK
jgi:hypothetical protein